MVLSTIKNGIKSSSQSECGDCGECGWTRGHSHHQWNDGEVGKLESDSGKVCEKIVEIFEIFGDFF